MFYNYFRPFVSVIHVIYIGVVWPGGKDVAKYPKYREVLFLEIRTFLKTFKRENQPTFLTEEFPPVFLF